MSKIIIFGASDLARLAHYYFSKDSEHEVVSFTVDKEYLNEELFCGLPIEPYEGIKKLYPPNKFKMFIAIGYKDMNKARAKKYYESKLHGYELVSYLSSKCTFLTENPIGDNCFILEDNTIQPFVKIGSNVILWSGNHLGHDSIIEDHTFISSHVVISGNVRVGEYSFLGVNSTVRDGIKIGAETFIGPGANITEDTNPKGTYLAQRAKLSQLKSEEIKI